MRISLSGFEGVGKSTLINKISNNVFKVQEPARFLIDFKETINIDKNDISYSALLINFNNYENILSNNIKNVIFDRNILDDIVYLIKYNNSSIDLKLIDNKLNHLLDKYNEEFLFDKIYFLMNTEEHSFIANKILSDPARKYCKTPEEYIQDADEWNKIFFYNFLFLNRLSKEIVFTSPYPNISKDIEENF